MVVSAASKTESVAPQFRVVPSVQLFDLTAKKVALLFTVLWEVTNQEGAKEWTMGIKVQIYCQLPEKELDEILANSSDHSQDAIALLAVERFRTFVSSNRIDLQDLCGDSAKTYLGQWYNPGESEQSNLETQA